MGKMDKVEITNIIYDTLMNNKQHCQLDLDRIDNQEINAENGVILFDYEDMAFRMNITTN